MLRLSGVVMRISGGRRAMRAPLVGRSVAGARQRPGSSATRLAARGEPARPSSASGSSRFRADVVAERLAAARRRAPAPRRPATPRASSRSSAHRKAASVLPLPVGAVTSTCSPAAMIGPGEVRCTSVGWPMRSANQPPDQRVKGGEGVGGHWEDGIRARARARARRRRRGSRTASFSERTGGRPRPRPRPCPRRRRVDNVAGVG